MQKNKRSLQLWRNGKEIPLYSSGKNVKERKTEIC